MTLIDASLAVCHALPTAAALPHDAQTLAEAAAFFDWEGGDTLGQHLFDAALWDDAAEALARAASSQDVALAAEASAAVAATARFALLSPVEREHALGALATAIQSDSFLGARRAALAEAKREPRRATIMAASERAAEAHAAAVRRRVAQDYVAVAPSPDADERIVCALYACTVAQLGPSILQPLGFPPSKLGLRSLVAACRHAGSQRAAALLGTAWHAADEPAPLIMRPAYVPPSVAAASTLVLVFSSLGWHGLVRAEYGATLHAVGEGELVVAHCLDTAQSWFMSDPTTGEYDDGAWWDARLAALCAPFGRVCVLGESMGATAALRFARHATHDGSVVALVPQVDVRDFGYSGRADFDDARKERLRRAVHENVRTASGRVVLHVGQDPPDLKQLAHLPSEEEVAHAGGRLTVVRHAVAGHALGAGLKARGELRKIVLRDLLGHSYMLPPAGETSYAWHAGVAESAPV